MCIGKAQGVDFFSNFGLMASESRGGGRNIWLNDDFNKKSKILTAKYQTLHRRYIILIFAMWPATWRWLMECVPAVAGLDLLPNIPPLFKLGSRIKKADCL